MGKEKFQIYGLYDPRTMKLRYVGKSQSGLERPKQHTAPSRLKKPSKKNSWIKSLLALGLKPFIRVLAEYAEETPEGLAQAETDTIKWCVENGFDLLNMTEGGDGGNTGGGQKRRRKIIATNLSTGEEINYPFIISAVKDGFSATHIVGVCKGKRKSHLGFSFRYEEESLRDLGQARPNGGKPVISNNIKTGATKLYPSALATKKDGFNPGTVSSICNQRKGYNQTKGYTFEYWIPPWMKPNETPVTNEFK